MIKEDQKVRIYWDDVVLYKKPKFPLEIEPTPKELEGLIVKNESKDIYEGYVTIKVDKKSKLVKDFADNINFFSIPKGMIRKIEEI
jgi:hypothetical protein